MEKKNRIVKENNSSRKIDLYGLSKLNSEKKLLKISNKVIKSILILRLSSILGKNSHSTFLSNLKNNFLKKKNIQIKNKDNLFNACFHINDLGIFINRLINSSKKGYDIINIASSKPVILEKVVNLFKKKYKRSKLTFLKETTPTYIVDIKKAVKKYKLQKINTVSTIRKYLESY